MTRATATKILNCCLFAIFYTNSKALRQIWNIHINIQTHNYLEIPDFFNNIYHMNFVKSIYIYGIHIVRVYIRT